MSDADPPGAHLSVDADRCRGHALCLRFASDALEYDEDLDQARVRSGAAAVPIADLRAAARSCPERAIQLHEVEFE